MLFRNMNFSNPYNSNSVQHSLTNASSTRGSNDLRFKLNKFRQRILEFPSDVPSLVKAKGKKRKRNIKKLTKISIQQIHKNLDLPQQTGENSNFRLRKTKKSRQLMNMHSNPNLIPLPSRMVRKHSASNAKLLPSKKTPAMNYNDCIVISSDSEDGQARDKNNLIVSKMQYPSCSSQGKSLSDKPLPVLGALPERKLSSGVSKLQMTQKRKAPNDEAANTDSKRLCLQVGNQPVAHPTHFDVHRLLNYDTLSQKINWFLEKNQQQPEFLKKKFELVQALENAMKFAIYPHLKIFLVGSSINGFGQRTSDADMCLVLDSNKKVLPHGGSTKILRQVQNMIHKAPFVKKLEFIPAKVPILKFVDDFSGMSCDINVNNLTGIRNTFLLFAYARYDPRVRPLIVCIKAWAAGRDINDASRSTLSSYALALMTIHFLQCGTSPPVLPSLQQIYPELFSADIPINQVEAHARRVVLRRPENNQPLAYLLRKFFHYFTYFDFDSKVMSVRTGTAYPVSQCADYKTWVKKKIKIEEPFDLTNVARAICQVVKKDQILHEFMRAHMLLQRTDDITSLIPRAR